MPDGGRSGDGEEGGGLAGAFDQRSCQNHPCAKEGMR
jgi:hypothetical protein